MLPPHGNQGAAKVPGVGSSIGERLVYALQAREMSQTGLEKAARLSKGYVSRMTKGERMKFSPDVLARTAQALRISTLWLATGQGEMEGADVPPPLPPSPAAYSSQTLEAALAYHDEKWSPATVAAARALAPKHTTLRPFQWAAALDRIEEALAKVKIE